MNESTDKKRHSVTVDSRSRGAVTGVNEVVSYGDDELVLATSEGRLTIAGKELKIVRFDTADGSLSFTGTVNSLKYAGAKVPLAKRIFG